MANNLGTDILKMQVSEDMFLHSFCGIYEIIVKMSRLFLDSDYVTFQVEFDATLWLVFFFRVYILKWLIFYIVHFFA